MGFKDLGNAVRGNISSSNLTGNPADIAKVLLELGKMPGRLRDFGDALLRSQDGLVAFSGRMANAAMKLEAERYGRAMRTAAATGSSYASLTGAQTRLESRLQPYQAAYQTLLNRVSGAVITVADKAVGLFESVTKIRALIERWLPELGKDPDMPVLNKVVRDMAYPVTERARAPLGGRP